MYNFDDKDQYKAHWLLLCKMFIMLLPSVIVDFILFHDGLVDMQIWTLLTRSQT